jgi:hypothetical protein
LTPPLRCCGGHRRDGGFQLVQDLLVKTLGNIHQVGRFVADAEAIYSYEGTRESTPWSSAAPSPA